MKIFTKISAIAIAFISANLGAASAVHMPKVTIKAITNSTPYNLVLTDRAGLNKPLTVLAGQTMEANLAVDKNRQVIIIGNMSSVMAKEAQFVINKLDQAGVIEADHETYLNMHLVEGGVDNGSGFICGTPGSIAMNFLMAGKKGGCIMSALRLTKNPCKLVESQLKLHMNENDAKNNVFKLYGSIELTEN